MRSSSMQMGGADKNANSIPKSASATAVNLPSMPESKAGRARRCGHPGGYVAQQREDWRRSDWNNPFPAEWAPGRPVHRNANAECVAQVPLHGMDRPDPDRQRTHESPVAPVHFGY